MQTAKSEGTGISIINFVAETTQKAERLSDYLLKAKLIADAELVSGGYERYYMKDKKEVVDDGLVKIRFVTADYMVPQVMKYIEEHNPNDKQGKNLPILAS